MTLAITRAVQACVLIEIDGRAVLTDPFLRSRWFLPLREPIGLRAAALPRLSAIVGGHGVVDHWHPRSLAGYAHHTETPVFVATPRMRAQALAAGFSRAEVLAWGTTRRVAGDLDIEVVQAQRTMGMTVNSYVLSCGTTRVFVGTEALDLDPIRSYRAAHPGVDVALLPIDASTLLGRPLVMGPAEALTAASVLGARVLVPIHYALSPLPPLLRTRGSLPQLENLRCEDMPQVVALAPGQRWVYAA